MTEEPTPTRCPKCGQASRRRDECDRCGVVFAKVRNKSPRPAAPAPPATASTRGGAGGRRLAVLGGAAALAFAALAIANADRERRAAVELTLASAEARVAPEPAKAHSRRVPGREAAPPEASPADTAAAPSRPSRPTQPVSASARAAEPRAVSASHNWYRDADGFLRGMREAADENKAVLVYFYTDWCPYCRRLDRDLLARQTVAGTTKHFVKVKVNPEHGRAERMLADRYGITGYPSLYVHEAGAERGRKIGTHTQGRLKRPAEFADSLTRAAGERFVSR